MPPSPPPALRDQQPPPLPLSCLQAVEWEGPGVGSRWALAQKSPPAGPWLLGHQSARDHAAERVCVSGVGEALRPPRG